LARAVRRDLFILDDGESGTRHLLSPPAYHRSFATPKWLNTFSPFAAWRLWKGPAPVGVHASQASPVRGPGGDPHSPRDGKWWAHVAGSSLATRCARTFQRSTLCPIWLRTSFTSGSRSTIFCHRLSRSRLVRHRGFRFVLWGVSCAPRGTSRNLPRQFRLHIWGARPFETRDASTNNWWVAC